MSSTKSNLAYDFSVTLYHLIVNDIIFGLPKLERCFLGQNVKVLLPVKSIYMTYVHTEARVSISLLYNYVHDIGFLFPYSGVGSSEVDNIQFMVVYGYRVWENGFM